MPDRFFLAETPQNDTAVLTGPEAHHLAHVLRARLGLEVTLFDGRGGEYQARVAGIERQQIKLEIVRHVAVERESPRALILAVSLPKGDRQRWLVEKAVELGVARLIPLATARGVAQPKSTTLDRLRRAVIEASKQCGRNRLLEITEPQKLSEIISATAKGQYGLCAAAQPGGQLTPSALMRRVAALPIERSVLAAIGPEGGFTTEELEQAAAGGWEALDLGSRILRVETAAIAVAAYVAACPCGA